jgi:hypothetical protein
MTATRQTKSDQGIQKLLHDLLIVGLGLDTKVTNRIIKLIHDQGQWATVKQHVRTTLPPEAWQRLNQGLDLADKGVDQDEPMDDEPMDDEPELDERDPEMEPEEPVGDGESDAEMAGGMDDLAPEDDPRMREGIAPTFLGFLTELTAQQTARSLVRDKGERRKAAMQTDMQRRQEIQGELEDYENSEDPQEKTLAMQIKRTATLRARVEQNRAAKEAQKAKEPQGTF